MTDHIPTEEMIESAAEAITKHSIGEIWGDDGVVYVECVCGERFGTRERGRFGARGGEAWDRAAKHTAQVALSTALPFLRPEPSEDDREPVRIHWYDCACEWRTKYCDERHSRAATVPRSVLALFEKGAEG